MSCQGTNSGGQYVCKPNVEGVSGLCAAGTTCGPDDNKCKTAGSSVTTVNAIQSFCADHKICVDGVCKIPAGSSGCDTDAEEPCDPALTGCNTDLVCDTKGKCNNDVTSSNLTTCATDICPDINVCEGDVCKIKQGASCPGSTGAC